MRLYRPETTEYGDQYVDLAVSMYFERAKQMGNLSPDQPCRDLTRREGPDIYIRNVNGLLAHYWIRLNGQLARVLSPDEIRMMRRR